MGFRGKPIESLSEMLTEADGRQKLQGFCREIEGCAQVVNPYSPFNRFGSGQTSKFSLNVADMLLHEALCMD